MKKDTPQATVLTSCGAARIDNRAAAGGEEPWIQLVPLGEYPGSLQYADGSTEAVIQVIDQEAAAAIVNHFARGQGEMLIDYEHHSHDLDKETVAAGWIRELQARPDGVYARTRWSGRGKADIEQRNYRFISPEFAAAGLQELDESEDSEHLGIRRVRPTTLDGAGLTNRPQMRGKPISNRGPGGPGKPTQTPHDTDMDNAKLTEALGLDAGAGEEKILAAISQARESAAKLTNRNQELEQRVKTLEDERLEQDLEANADVIGQDERESARELLIANRESALKHFAGVRKRLEKKPGSLEAERLHNRGAKPPEGEAERAEKDRARAARIRNRAGEIAEREKLSWSAAWKRAEAETD